MKTDNQNRGHLTAKEISQWLVEGPEQSAAQHVQNCWTCQAKLTEAQQPLTAFRSALVNWSEAQAQVRLSVVPGLAERNERSWRLRLWLPAATFALAALLLVGYAKIPALLHSHATGQQQSAAASTSATDSDAALMDQVDTEVSEAVPDAMAPLTDLVSWDSTDGSAIVASDRVKLVVHKTSSKGTSVKGQIHPTD
jgi:hypothetical protein